MPKRVLDFDALWGSDKLAACAEEAQAEYAWLYGLADASGCFELTNLRVIWGRVAAIRRSFSIERLEFVFAEFQDKGLLFVWEQGGKRYGHWTGSDVPGRLPAPSWRMRLERFAPPVPKEKLAEYMARFSRGRAAMAGAGFGAAGNSIREAEKERRKDEERVGGAQITDERLLMAVGDAARRGDLERRAVGGAGGIKAGLEEAQAQDWNGNWKKSWDRDGNCGAGGNAERGADRLQPAEAAERASVDQKFTNPSFSNSNATANGNSKTNTRFSAEAAGSAKRLENLRSAESEASDKANGKLPEEMADGTFDARELIGPVIHAHAARDARNGFWRDRYRERELAAQREARVGQGPVCGAGCISAAGLERIRKREEERAAARGK